MYNEDKHILKKHIDSVVADCRESLERKGFAKDYIDIITQELETNLLYRETVMECWNQSAEAMAKPEEKAQRQEPVDLNSYEEQKALRTKALELACAIYNTPYFNKYEDAVEVAQRFYTYITKGK